MKKLLTLATVAALIFGLAAATYAVELNVSGDVFTRTAWHQNANAGQLNLGPDSPYSALNTGFDDINSWVDTRFRTKFDFVASEDLHGVLWFEMGEQNWGVAAGTGIGQWGADYIGAEVKQAYLDFKVPGTDAFPTRLSVGVQGFNLGKVAGLDRDAAGVKVNTKAGPADIGLLWIKKLENVTYQADDVDGYAASVGIPLGAFTPKIWTLYGIMGTGYRTPSHPNGTGSDSGYSLHVGVAVDGKVGPASIAAEGIYMTGEIDYSVAYTTTGWLGVPAIYGGEEYDGFCFYMKGSVPINMLEVGGEFMYATGDDLADVASNQEYGYRRPVTGGEPFFEGIIYYSSVVNWMVGYGASIAPDLGDAGTAGDWVAAVFASVKPLDWLKVTLKGTYIGDNVENGDRYGTAQTLAGLPEDNDYAGIEIDLFTRFQIYDNLTYEIGAGYLLAGSALDQYDAATSAVFALPMNQSPKDPWAVVSCLNYAF